MIKSPAEYANPVKLKLILMFRPTVFEGVIGGLVVLIKGVIDTALVTGINAVVSAMILTKLVSPII